MSSIAEEHDRKPAPAIGEHNRKIYSELLGYTDKEIEDLNKEGVI